jgi:23S rRNA (adenine2503-C2)-methyltransferase
LCHVNIIPLNPTEGFAGQPANLDKIGRFVTILETYNIPATVRVRRGIDIHAGCGQLATSVSG